MLMTEPPDKGASWTIEVPAGEGPAAIATLRAAGHEIIRAHKTNQVTS
jgi:hypothetical protein